MDPSAIASPTATRQETARNILFVGAAQAWRIAVGFAFAVVTARLLTPSDFGLLAMVATTTALVALTQDLGATHAVIQRDRISAGQLNSLFWVSVGVGAILALLLVAAAPAVARFFGEPRMESLTTASAILIAAGGLQAIPMALLNRALRFGELAIIEALAATASFVVGVALAWQLGSYWALYWSQFAFALVTLVGCWSRSGFVPGRPAFDREARSMIGFGSGVTGFNILNYLSRNADNILIGKFYGDGALGLYDRAYRLLLFPLYQINSPIGRVITPLLSRAQTDAPRYRRIYSECVSLLLLATQPAVLFATVFSEDVFRILLGERWLACAPIFSWLGFCGLHQLMTSTMGWLFISQGRGGDFFRIGLFGASTTVLSFVAGLPWGPVGVAAAYAISDYVVRLPVVWASVGRRGPVSTRDLYAMAMPHALATVVAAAVLLLLKSFDEVSAGVIGCGLLLALTYTVYLAVLALFPDKRAYLLQNSELMRGRWRGETRAG